MICLPAVYWVYRTVEVFRELHVAAALSVQAQGKSLNLWLEGASRNHAAVQIYRGLLEIVSADGVRFCELLMSCQAPA